MAEEETRREEEEEEGVAPLLKSRDTHLAGGEECLNMFRRCVYFDPASGCKWKQKPTEIYRGRWYDTVS